MKRLGAERPEDAQLATFQLDLDFAVVGVFGISVKVRAMHAGDARVRVRHQMDTDTMFREAVIDELLRVARRDGEFPWQVRETESGDVEELAADRDYEVFSRDT
jgi:hypothetical protein